MNRAGYNGRQRQPREAMLERVRRVLDASRHRNEELCAWLPATPPAGRDSLDNYADTPTPEGLALMEKWGKR